MSVIPEFQQAAAAQQRVLASEAADLRALGIEPVTPEAIPHYANQARSDLVLMVWLMYSMVRIGKTLIALLIVIAILLAVTAYEAFRRGA